jgi:hypothetical protein
MIRALFSHVSRFHHRALALLHGTDQTATGGTERRERWNQAIAGYKTRLKRQARTSTSPTSGPGSADEDPL